MHRQMQTESKEIHNNDNNPRSSLPEKSIDIIITVTGNLFVKSLLRSWSKRKLRLDPSYNCNGLDSIIGLSFRC